MENTNNQHSHEASLQVEDFHNMIWSIVHRKIRSHGIKSEHISEAQEDLFCEGGVIFLHSIDSYREDEGTLFSTWLYTQLDYRLGNYIKRKLFHLTFSGASRFESIHDMDENLFLIQAEKFGGFISEEKEKIIDGLYSRAFKKWNIDKCAFLYFVYAFDQTGNYNKYLLDFIKKNQNFLLDVGVSQKMISELNLETLKMFDEEKIRDIKRSVCHHFEKDPKTRQLILNNVKKTIDYYLEKEKKWLN